MKTQAEQQIELLRQMKAGRAAPPSAPTEAEPGAEASKPAPKPVPKPAPKRAAAPKPKSLNVDARTWGRLEERRRAEFKDTRAMAAWAARLLLALPVGVAGLEREVQEDLFRQMRQWAEKRGLR